jgi:hypothetical protein
LLSKNEYDAGPVCFGGDPLQILFMDCADNQYQVWAIKQMKYLFPCTATFVGLGKWF